MVQYIGCLLCSVAEIMIKLETGRRSCDEVDVHQRKGSQIEG